MRCPQCQGYGQEMSTEAGTRLQPGTYECNTSECAVMRFDENGAVTAWARQPDDDEED